MFFLIFSLFDCIMQFSKSSSPNVVINHFVAVKVNYQRWNFKKLANFRNGEQIDC